MINNYCKNIIFSTYSKQLNCKKVLVLITIILTFVSNSTSQDISKVDSLEHQIKNDSIYSLQERINFTLRLIDVFSDSNPEKADNYILSAIDFAEQLKDTTQLISLWIKYAENKNNQCNYLESDKAYQAAKTIILKTGLGSEKAKILFSIGTNFYDWGKYLDSRTYYEKALNEFTALKDKKGIALSLTELSPIASNFGDYEMAIGYLQRARDIYIEIDDFNNLAYTSQMLGIILEKWSKIDRALVYYQLAYKHFDEENDQLEKVNLLFHIGNVYLKQGKFAKALENYKQAISINKRVNNIKLLSIGYNNLGKTYFAMKEYDIALYFQEKALRLKYEVGDKKHIAISQLNIGEIYFAINKTKLAQENILQCLQIAHNSGLKEIEMEALLLLSKINDSELNYKKSYDYLKKYGYVLR